MLKIEYFQEIISKEIKNISFPLQPKLLYAPIKYTLQTGGKRLRPALVLLGCHIYNDDLSNAIKPAIAIEIFHNFTLLHDDIMDNSAIRRNQATVHKKWNSNIAILSGDAMQIMAYKFLTELPTETLKLVLETFNETAIQVCEGQQYDMDFETHVNVTIDEYLLMIRLKTSVLLAAALKIGAIIGGASQSDANILYKYAQNIGLAFQLQDDYLDTYGDVKIFGKKIGNDIITNKKTFLLINALNLSEGKIHENLQKLILDTEIEPKQKIQSVTEIYNSLNIKQITKQKVKYYFEEASNLLEKINIPDEKKQQLLQFANLLIDRKY